MGKETRKELVPWKNLRRSLPSNPPFVKKRDLSFMGGGGISQSRGVKTSPTLKPHGIEPRSAFSSQLPWRYVVQYFHLFFTIEHPPLPRGVSLGYCFTTFFRRTRDPSFEGHLRSPDGSIHLGGVFIRNRNGAPYRKGRVGNGQMIKASVKQLPPTPHPTLLPHAPSQCVPDILVSLI